MPSVSCALGCDDDSESDGETSIMIVYIMKATHYTIVCPVYYLHQYAWVGCIIYALVTHRCASIQAENTLVLS